MSQLLLVGTYSKRGMYKLCFENGVLTTLRF